MTEEAKPEPTAPKPRGRRPHHGTALSRAEIQRNYRERRAQERFVDFELVDKLSRVSLVAGIGSYLAALDKDGQDEDARDAARWAAEKYLGALIRRYGLKPRK